MYQLWPHKITFWEGVAYTPWRIIYFAVVCMITKELKKKKSNLYIQHVTFLFLILHFSCTTTSHKLYGCCSVDCLEADKRVMTYCYWTCQLPVHALHKAGSWSIGWGTFQKTSVNYESHQSDWWSVLILHSLSIHTRPYEMQSHLHT